jgi:hypothetical protein
VSRPALRPTKTSVQWVPGALTPGLKRPGHEDDHSPPSSAEVKNAWSYTSSPPYVFMAWRLVKHRDNFTFTFAWRDYGNPRKASVKIASNLAEILTGYLRSNKSGTSPFFSPKTNQNSVGRQRLEIWLSSAAQAWPEWKPLIVDTLSSASN